MKLTEFNMKPTLVAKKALKEHFNTTLNVERLGLYDTTKMLRKVKGLMSEMKSGESFATESNPAYMKLMFMEQALVHRYGELKAMPMYNQRIVVENEEVEKSQVVLAANEMIDEMQKMIENVSDMLVKELPAVVDGVNAEIGTNEGEQFNSQVSEALTQLQAALTSSKSGLQSALGIITGQGGFGAGAMGGAEDMGMDDTMPDDDIGGDEMGDDLEMGGAETDMGEPEDEEPIPNVGRTTR
jgi:hypothetical protein